MADVWHTCLIRVWRVARRIALHDCPSLESLLLGRGRNVCYVLSTKMLTSFVFFLTTDRVVRGPLSTSQDHDHPNPLL